MCVYNRILFSHAKEGNSAVCDTTDEPGGIKLSEISQRQTNTV